VLFLAAAAALGVDAQPPRQSATIPMFLPEDPSDNTFQATPVLPVELRRVVVLPAAWEGSKSDLSSGGETLEPILLAELLKTRRFEVVAVDPEDLRGLTGRLSWTGEEILPVDFFDSLRRVYGCDAVLFFQVTLYQAYAPLSVGWRMKLVDARTHQILWAVDEVFDAAQPAVLNQARLFHAVGAWSLLRDSATDWQTDNSPRVFGRYALAKTLSTLPNRKDMIKVSSPITDEPSKRWLDNKPKSAK
jgi:hypothetical protein